MELLPDSVQQKIRDGEITPHVAMKFLVPVARANIEHCKRMAGVFARHKFSSREAGELYAAWLDTSPEMRNRILQQAALFLNARREINKQKPDTEATVMLWDLEMVSAIANRAGQRWRQTATLINEADIDRACPYVNHALGELKRLARRIEQEKKCHAE